MLFLSMCFENSCTDDSPEEPEMWHVKEPRMRTAHKNLSAILLMISMGMVLYAQTLQISIASLPYEVEELRLQLNGVDSDSWEILERGEALQQWSINADTSDVLNFQYRDSQGDWGDVRKMVYSAEHTTWKLVPEQDLVEQEKESLLLHASAGVSVITPLNPLPDTFYTAAFGLSARIAMEVSKYPSLTGFADLIYAYGPSDHALVEEVHEVGLSVGAAYAFPLGIVTLSPELSGGGMLHIPRFASGDVMVFADGAFRAGLRITRDILEGISVYAGAGVLYFPEQYSDYGLLGEFASGLRVSL